MKSFVGWIIVFILFWGVASFVAGVDLRHKSKNSQRFAKSLFVLPLIFLAIDSIKDFWISSNYRASVEEVKVLCAKDGGDKIYKTVENVEGVFQMRARKTESYRRPDGSFYYAMSDQYGMEDPYGKALNDDDDISSFVGHSYSYQESSPTGKQGYWFVEQQPQNGSTKRSLFRRTILEQEDKPISSEAGIYKLHQMSVVKLKSQYGFYTEDLTTNEMRDHWIGAGRIRIVNLKTNEVLAERMGYFRASGDLLPSGADRWTASGADENRICPSGGLLKFLQSVLKPPEDFPSREELESLRKD